jgi:hypothetical protein
LGPIRVGTGDGAARAFVFPDTFSFRRRELKVRSIATLPNPVGVNERPERGNSGRLQFAALSVGLIAARGDSHRPAGSLARSVAPMPQLHSL